MKLWAGIFFVVCADAAGNMLLRHGMRRIGHVEMKHPREILRIIQQVAKNGTLRLGILCMGCAFFMFLSLLSRADLSLILPATALGAAVNTLGAQFILKENVTVGRWLGTLFICAGVAALSFQSAG